MDGVDLDMIVGVNTEVRPLVSRRDLFLFPSSSILLFQVIAGEKLIVTAGAIDSHVHYICPGLWKEVGSSPPSGDRTS